MSTVPGYPRITASGLTGSHVAYACPPTGTDPRDQSIIYSEVLAWLAANGLIATSLIDEPDGVAGLNEDGQIVGPIVLSTYADAAEAGVLPNGTLGQVDGVLHLGDGSTTGGVSVANANRLDAPIISGMTPSVALDATANRALIFLEGEALTISNAATLPDGYEVIILCASGSETIAFTGNDSGPIDGAGYYTFLKQTGNWYIVGKAPYSGGG